MKKTLQTALTAAAFAAALGMTAAGSTVSAMTEFSPESQQIAAVLYGPPPGYQPPVEGDANEDRILDARDLSLMKRGIFLDDLHEGDDDYRKSKYDGRSARLLMQRLTGEEENPQHPIAFTVYFKPVAYFSDEAPESQEEREALERDAENRLGQTEGSERFILTDPATGKRRSVELHEPGATYTYLAPGLGKTFELSLRDGFVPNAEEDGVRLHKSLLQWSIEFAKYGESFTVMDYDGENASLGVAAPRSSNVKEYSADFVTFRSDPEAGDTYYDKCVVEWNVNTDELRIGKPLTMDQALPE